MSEQENVQRAQAAYAACGRGDIPAFMDTLADTIEWVLTVPADRIGLSPAASRRTLGRAVRRSTALALVHAPYWFIMIA